MKRVLILGATLFAAFPLMPVTSAHAVECLAQAGSARGGYWSYRLVDGRKCWYEGKRKLSKTELHWGNEAAPAQAATPASAPKPKAAAAQRAAPEPEPVETNAQASPGVDSNAFSDPEDGSCCWPASQQRESFESRWHSLGLKPRN